MERTEVSAFFLTFFAPAGVKILRLHEKIEYAVALFPMMGYRMAQESSQYHLRFRTYAGRKNSLLLLILLLLLLILLMLIKNSSNKKGYVGVVGSHPTLLL